MKKQARTDLGALVKRIHVLPLSELTTIIGDARKSVAAGVNGFKFLYGVWHYNLSEDQDRLLKILAFNNTRDSLRVYLISDSEVESTLRSNSKINLADRKPNYSGQEAIDYCKNQEEYQTYFLPK